MENKHGKTGHLNTIELDQDSQATSFGKHARVVAFHPQDGELYCRVDRACKVRKTDAAYPNLPDPDVSQVLSVARKLAPVLGRWVVKSVEHWPNGECIDVVFTRANPSPNSKATCAARLSRKAA